MTNEILHTNYHSKRLQYGQILSKDGKKLPHRYCFILTNKCNLNCHFCFQERKGRAGSLTKDDWLNLCDQLPEYAHVTLTGGEPLVFKGFKEVFQKVTNKFTCNIITNGLLLNDELIDLFVTTPNFLVLSISIDDIGNLNRDVRPDHWEKMIVMVNKLKEKINEHKSNLIIDIKTVVLDTNSHELFDIYKYLREELNCDTHSFQILKGSPVQHADYTFNYETIYDDYKAHEYKNFDLILEQLDKVRLYNLDNKKISYTHPGFVNLNSKTSIIEQKNTYLINKISHNPKEFKTCNSPWESVHVNVEGTIYPCLAVEMGNIKNNTLKDIFFGNKYNEFKDTISKCGTVGACNRCGYLIPA